MSRLGGNARGGAIALVCGLAMLASCGAGAQPGWPAIDVDPIPVERIPETIPRGAQARCDSIRALLDSVFADGRIPDPPRSADPRLVAWIAQILSFPASGEVEAFANGPGPEAWSAADTAGVLPLVATLALHEIGRDEEALVWCEQGRVSSADLPYRALLSLELHDALGDSSGAAAAAERIAARSPHDPILYQPAAARIIDASESDPAALLAQSLRLRRSLGRGPDETAARYRALTALGRTAEAMAVGDTLIRAFPGTRAAREEALRRFHARGKPLTRAEREAVLDVLMRNRLFAAADTLVSRPPASDSLRIVRLEGLLAARQYAAVLADRAVRSGRLSRGLAERWRLVRARAARNSGVVATMQREYAAAAALGGEARRTALTEWAREAESNQRESQADSLYSLLMKIPGSADEARFRRGIARFARGRLANAETDFGLLRGTAHANAAAFWRFKIAGARGDSAAARAALAQAAEGSGGYYVRRAQQEVALRAEGIRPGAIWSEERARLFPGGPGSPAAAVPSGEGLLRCDVSPRLRARADRVRLLRRFAREPWAEREQEILESEAPVERRDEIFLCLGLPDLAVRVAVGRGAASPLWYRYPRPFAGWISRTTVVSPALVWAVARRESLFDPGAVSPAGARGLLQLMDETAIETARHWGVSPGPLERADRNIALGTSHLRELGSEHDWPLPALIAAYNAGASKTGEWVARFPDPDLFVERIGWRETRDYVRNVLEACWIYMSVPPAGSGG